MRNWGVGLLILGVGSFFLPMAGLQFRLLIPFGDAAPLVGGVMALAGGGLLIAALALGGQQVSRRVVIKDKDDWVRDETPMAQPVSSQDAEAISETPLAQRASMDLPRPPARLAARPASSVMAHIEFPGMSFAVDIPATVHFDGRLLGDCSVIYGFHFEVETTPGWHQVQVQTSIRGTKTYDLDFTRPGEYFVQISYSRLWGNFASKCEVRSLLDG